MIVITGAAGFIASCLAAFMNEKQHTNLVLVDDFSVSAKENNWKHKNYLQLVHRDQLEEWLDQNHKHVDFVFHLGARTDTTEFSEELFNRLNLNYSKMVWKQCVKYQLPLVYASSAATYGGGEFGYSDNHELSFKLHPLNPYGYSKLNFDRWVLQQNDTPPSWAGLRFFNVYGPNEYHKGRMASVILHSFNQINEKGSIRLFRSHRPDYTDGGQKRDFVYVKDVVKVCYFLFQNRNTKAIFNLGSTQARTFLDLAMNVFESLDKEPSIEFIDTPEDIRDKYQYFTEADMRKLREAGYQVPFFSLEEGIKEYVQMYLNRKQYY